MAIRLTRIYTRAGDKGLTALVGGARVPKDGPRLDAYGTVDELNAIVGIVRTILPDYMTRLGADGEWFAAMLARVQNELFDVGSELATPAGAAYAGMHRMGDDEVRRLEQEMDRMQRALDPLNSFTLPGGGMLNAFLHQARTVCRRAERVCWALSRGEGLNDKLLKYLNRLSDHLFVQSRWTAKLLGEPEFLWRRGLESAPRRRPGGKSGASRGGANDSGV